MILRGFSQRLLRKLKLTLTYVPYGASIIEANRKRLMDINPKVIDISHYNNVEFANGHYLGFQKIYEAGYRGVINKATQGVNYVDPTFHTRKDPARIVGLLYGAYHYMTLDDPVTQANFFVDTVEPDKDMLLALDYELRGVSLARARAFMERVYSRVGRYPWLYSGFLIKEQLGNRPDAFWGSKHLWLAHYTTVPTWPKAWLKPTLWQFTGDGNGPEPHQVPGVTISGGCDINSFAGSDEELAKIWGH